MNYQCTGNPESGSLMAYQINKTDGTLLVQLVDGSIDTATTDITLIGRNYPGW